MKQLILVFVVFAVGCSSQDRETILLEKTHAYFAAWNQHQFKSKAFAKFKKDTSRFWHGKKEGPGSVSIFNADSGWKQWDKAWNGTYSYEITEVNLKESRITGNFNERTDFLTLIGIPEGFSASVSFWFDEENRVVETLYDWKDGQSMHENIKPLVEWAKEFDSATIHRIYLKNGFKPSTKNAADWKKLLKAYPGTFK